MLAEVDRDSFGADLACNTSTAFVFTRGRVPLGIRQKGRWCHRQIELPSWVGKQTSGEIDLHDLGGHLLCIRIKHDFTSVNLHSDLISDVQSNMTRDTHCADRDICFVESDSKNRDRTSVVRSRFFESDSTKQMSRSAQ